MSRISLSGRSDRMISSNSFSLAGKHWSPIHPRKAQTLRNVKSELLSCFLPSLPDISKNFPVPIVLHRHLVRGGFALWRNHSCRGLCESIFKDEKVSTSIVRPDLSRIVFTRSWEFSSWAAKTSTRTHQNERGPGGFFQMAFFSSGRSNA